MTENARKDITAPLEYEHALYAENYRYIAGVDEAGRGAWAGPIAVGVVALPLADSDLEDRLHGVRDSKTMTIRQRATHAETIRKVATAYSVGMASVQEIALQGLMGALRLAYARALAEVKTRFNFDPDFLLLDYTNWKEDKPHYNIKKGDNKSLSIACASVLAKTTRDAVMSELVTQYPRYAFEKHKGYGTKEHANAIVQYGILDGIHRTSFAPIRRIRENS